MNNINRYYYGFDYLRAILPFFVIAIHTRFIAVYGNVSSEVHTAINLFDLIHFNLLMLAVPSFFIISLFLFFKKKKTTVKENAARIYKLFILYVFWAGLWVLIRKPYPNPPDIAHVVMFIVRGGNSIFYYFFTLIILTSISLFMRKIQIKFIWFLMVFSLISINAAFPLLNMYDASYKYLVAYWNPILFIPCVFAAKLIVFYEEEIRTSKKHLLMLSVCFLIVSIVEWHTLIHPNHKLIAASEMPSYARVSPILGASLLVLLSMKVINKPRALIMLLSSASLGMYCVHPFLLIHLNFIRNSSGTILYFITISSVSLICTYVLKSIFRERLI